MIDDTHANVSISRWQKADNYLSMTQFLWDSFIRAEIVFISQKNPSQNYIHKDDIGKGIWQYSTCYDFEEPTIIGLKLNGRREF